MIRLSDFKKCLKYLIHFLALAVFFKFAIGCARSPLKNRMDAMRPQSIEQDFNDDLEFNSLVQGLEAQIIHLEKSKLKDRKMTFGPYMTTQKAYADSLRGLLQTALTKGREGFYEKLRKEFVTLQAYGGDSWGEMFITSYYEPVIKGSANKTKELSEPIYGIPSDLVLIRLDQFAERLDRWRTWAKQNTEQKSEMAVARGRIVKNDETGVAEIVPYLERKEISAAKLPAPILAWVDPIDAFMLQIQGSGSINIKGKQPIRVSYAAQNGYPYQAIGKFLVDVIPLEEMTMQKIEAQLRSMDEAKRQELLGKNPSYVFFQRHEGRGITHFGTRTIPGRTIATDHGFFPKGALAFLSFPKPVLADQKSDLVSEWQQTSRFVFDQDTGGAIRGGHRVDLFWGDGDAAKQVAGVMKQKGQLFYLYPKAALSE